MSKKLNPVSYKELVKVFEAEGFRLVCERGDHMVFTKPGVIRPEGILMTNSDSRDRLSCCEGFTSFQEPAIERFHGDWSRVLADPLHPYTPQQSLPRFVYCRSHLSESGQWTPNLVELLLGGW
jgi:hypothetical protein